MADNKEKNNKNFRELNETELDNISGGIFERVERRKDPAQSLQPGIKNTRLNLSSKAPR